MDLIRFQEILEAVPASHWESHLDIGDFAGVECLTTVTRTFSHVARCRGALTVSRTSPTMMKPPSGAWAKSLM